MPRYNYVITTQGSYEVEVPDPTPEELEEQARRDRLLAEESNRSIRNAALARCDWTQTVDAPLTAELKQQWADYRTELRNIPLHTSWPNLTYEDWPIAPDGSKAVMA